jgi:hypothetical protein
MKKKAAKKPIKVTKKAVKKALVTDLKQKGINPEWLKSHLVII